MVGIRSFPFGMAYFQERLLLVSGSIFVANGDRNILDKGSPVLISSLIQFHDPLGSSLQSLHCRIMTNYFIFAPEPAFVTRKMCSRVILLAFFTSGAFFVLHFDVGFKTQN